MFRIVGRKHAKRANPVHQERKLNLVAAREQRVAKIGHVLTMVKRLALDCWRAYSIVSKELRRKSARVWRGWRHESSDNLLRESGSLFVPILASL